MQNKLIVHVCYYLQEFNIDDERLDPDGVPLVVLCFQRVTRARKMTDKEYEDLFKDGTHELLVRMKYVGVNEQKEKGKDGEPEVSE